MEILLTLKNVNKNVENPFWSFRNCASKNTIFIYL